MQLKQTQNVVRVPGNPQATPRTSPEWVCPECDYFEEIDDE
jgi:hypothetical protein